MPVFQFTALDASGKEKRGTIEAVTQQDAYVAIQRYGLHPTQVVVVNQPATPPPGGFPGPAPYSAEMARRPSGGGGFTTFLAVLALLISLGVAGWEVYRQFFAPGSRKDASEAAAKGLSGYKLTTPEDAFRSQWLIRAKKDYRAVVELGLVGDPPYQEMLDTLKVEKEADWNDKKVLFISYKRGGEQRYDTPVLAKDPVTGFWKQEYVDPAVIGKDKPELGQLVTNWREKGQLK
jgi:hypothetical protein